MPVAATPELRFAVQDAAPLAHAAAPSLCFGLRIDSGEAAIRSVLLDVQLQIAARRRAYDEAAEARLYTLFGEAERWGATLRTLLWTRTTLVVGPFERDVRVELPVPCTYDFGVAASTYLDAIRDGEIPLELLFGGTFFYGGADGRLQVGRVSADSEATYRLPARVWHETMERYFPDSAWLRLAKDTFDRLHAYRSARAITSWEDAIDGLLARAEEG